MHNFTFSGLSLLGHLMYAVSVREDRGFELTKKRFNTEKKWQRYVEDSGVIQSIPVVVNARIASEWVINCHSH